MSFPGVSDSKVSACNAGDPSWIPGLGISPGEGNGYPLQYSCLENSTDRGEGQAAVHGVAKDTTEQLTLSVSLKVPCFCYRLPAFVPGSSKVVNFLGTLFIFCREFVSKVHA